MITVLGDVLGAAEVAALRGAAADIAFEDGRATAGRYARGVKANEQAKKSSELDAILEKARAALNGHELFRSVARPRKFTRLLLSRYEPGMEYGTHVDDPIMRGSRTDMSFTMPLTPTEEYDGGALIMEEGVESRRFVVDPGDVIVYPTGVLHRVEPVTRGRRVAIVGWVQSWVRDGGQREILHDLDVAAKAVFDKDGKSPAFDRLFKAKSNLYRMWAEG